MTIDIKTVRRKEKQKDDQWIRDFIQSSHYGVLGVSAEGQPYLNANNYVYIEADHALYFHRAKQGALPQFIEKNNNATYLISEMGKMMTGKEAMKFSVEYKSVMIYGKLQEITDHTKKTEVLRKLLEKTSPDLEYGEDYVVPPESAITRTAIWALKIDFWTGKESLD